MALKNPWVGYLDRSYEQIRDNILSKFPAKVPEITDLSENSTTTKEVGIWAGLMEMLGYYVDRKAREVFLPTARRFASGVKWASTVGYRIRGRVAASADITFKTGAATLSAFSIPAGTIITTREDIRFVTTSAAAFGVGATEITVPARQWLLRPSVIIGFSTGLANQNFSLEESVVDSSISVLINGVNYTPVETFIFSLPTDAHFVASVNENNVMAITFGDGINGNIPTGGQPIAATFYVSEGTGGNVAARTLTVLPTLDTVPDGVTVTAFNVNRAGGGTSAEGLEELRKRIPKFIRTQNRAVTNQDYLDVAELAPGVARAGLVFNCGKQIDIYVAPEGGGVASSPLLASVEAFFEDKRMSTTLVKALSAGAVQMQLTVKVNAFPNYTNSQVQAMVLAALVNFFSVENQMINGSIIIGDVYQVIEAVEGVQNSEITLLNVLPYARPINNSSQLDWMRVVTPASTALVTWRLKYMSTSTYQITKGNVYTGLYAVGDLVDLGEVKITVNGTGLAGNEYNFISYPYNRGTVFLAEPSIPVAFEEDLTILVTGGI